MKREKEKHKRSRALRKRKRRRSKRRWSDVSRRLWKLAGPSFATRVFQSSCLSRHLFVSVIIYNYYTKSRYSYQSTLVLSHSHPQRVCGTRFVSATVQSGLVSTLQTPKEEEWIAILGFFALITRSWDSFFCNCLLVRAFVLHFIMHKFVNEFF